MKTVVVVCCACGMNVRKREIDILRNGPRFFCNRICSAFSKRKWKTSESKKAAKADYDRLYRAKNLRRIKRQKAKHFRETYDPVKAAIERKKNMPRHVAYCRRPEYRKKKSRYDFTRRASLNFGPFADSYKLLIQLENEVGKRMSDYEIRFQQGTLNKKQTRQKALA